MFKHDRKIERLRGNELLAECTGQDLRAVASAGDLISVHKGDEIHGSERGFFLLTSGEATTGETVLGAGDALGLTALLGGRPGTDLARMTSDGSVLALGRREFTSLMRRVPGFAFGVARNLARQATASAEQRAS